MIKLDFATIPLLIAMILGKTFESSVRRALLISHGDFMIFIIYPIALGFVILAVLVLVLAIRQRRKIGFVYSQLRRNQ